jgi:hypothetical protein
MVCHTGVINAKLVLAPESSHSTMSRELRQKFIYKVREINTNELKQSQESMGAAAAGMKKQVAETAVNAKEKVADLGRDAAGQLSEVVQTVYRQS